MRDADRFSPVPRIGHANPMTNKQVVQTVAGCVGRRSTIRGRGTWSGMQGLRCTALAPHSNSSPTLLWKASTPPAGTPLDLRPACREPTKGVASMPNRRSICSGDRTHVDTMTGILEEFEFKPLRTCIKQELSHNPSMPGKTGVDRRGCGVISALPLASCVFWAVKRPVPHTRRNTLETLA